MLDTDFTDKRGKDKGEQHVFIIQLRHHMNSCNLYLYSSSLQLCSALYKKLYRILNSLEIVTNVKLDLWLNGHCSSGLKATFKNSKLKVMFHALLSLCNALRSLLTKSWEFTNSGMRGNKPVNMDQ